MTLLTKGMGAVKKIMAKTAAGRKDQVLDTIRKSRNRRLPKKLQNKKIKIKGIGEVKSDQYIMDPETYDKVLKKKFKSRK